MLEGNVYNQLTEGTTRIYFSDVPYLVLDSDELNVRALEFNMIKWNISGIDIPIETDNFMTTTQELPISRSNMSGTLDAEIAIDERLDNYYVLWKWARAYMKSVDRKDGGSPYGRQLIRKAYCMFAEIPILDNNLNETSYIQLEKVRLRSISGFSFGSYSNKSVMSKATFVFNDIKLDRISRKIAT